MNATRVELLKARRSRLPWVTLLAFTTLALVGGLFMFILQDERRAHALGLLGAKASLAGGGAAWPTYFAFLAQATAVGGTIVFGLVLVWMFGREFSQNTAKDLLALPIPRAFIVGAKFAVATAWCLVLVMYTYLLSLLVGAALALPGWTAAVAGAALLKLVAIAVMTILLMTPIGLAASVGRGYLAGVGILVAIVFLAQIIAAVGYGNYFPWSVPALFSGLAGPDQTPPGPIGYTLVGLVGAAGMLATVLWWRNADQDR
jgi:ABC-2 type transport system permease protein